MYSYMNVIDGNNNNAYSYMAPHHMVNTLSAKMEMMVTAPPLGTFFRHAGEGQCVDSYMNMTYENDVPTQSVPLLVTFSGSG